MRSTLNSTLQHRNTETLVVHCGDFRFQGAFYEFLNRALSLKENYDLMVVPGGPLSLALPNLHSDFQAAWRWLRFFIEAHGVRRVILVQHQDCAWYRTILVHVHDVAELRLHQEQDLKRVREKLSKDFPDLRVEPCYAGWEADGRFTIEALPL